MKVVILAGGMGTRLAEETDLRPKPMVEIGGMPILWHIMMHYSAYGHSEFAIALGYRGEYIKRFFADYCSLEGDLTVNTGTGEITRTNIPHPDWKVHLVDTGVETQTGGRVKRLEHLLRDGTFMMTWGDGVSNIDLDALLDFHKSHGKLATLTAVRPPSRFGHLKFEGDAIREFSEKPEAAEGWINGAFLVLEPGVLDYIDGDTTEWDRGPVVQLAKEGQLMAYRHQGFWKCMDTLREKRELENIWASGDAPWKTWD